MNLADGSIVKTFPDVTGADLLAYSPNLRRFYTGTGGNKSTTTGCPSNTDMTTFPIVGEISPLNGGSLSGVLCAARGTKAEFPERLRLPISPPLSETRWWNAPSTIPPATRSAEETSLAIPFIGGVILLGADGVPAAKGTITAMP